jgi:ribosomal protein L37AE/L43A
MQKNAEIMAEIIRLAPDPVRLMPDETYTTRCPFCNARQVFVIRPNISRCRCNVCEKEVKIGEYMRYMEELFDYLHRETIRMMEEVPHGS